MLLTERLHARSTHQSNFRNPMRLKKVKLSMARIKVVLGERSGAYQEAKRNVSELYVAARKEENQANRLAHLQRELDRLAKKTQEAHDKHTSAAAEILSGETSAAPQL